MPLLDKNTGCDDMRNMKQRKIEITVAQNGYVVRPQQTPEMREDGYYGAERQIWAFESMESLQKRLPEILDVAGEVRAARNAQYDTECAAELRNQIVDGATTGRTTNPTARLAGGY